MSLRERAYSNLVKRRERLLKGEINCVSLPFTRFKSEFPGIEQGVYYLVSGATKAGKTQLIDYLFVFKVIMYSYYNKDKMIPRIFYYNLEETDLTILYRFYSFLLYELDGIIISSTDLQSTNNDAPVPENILKLLDSDKYKDIIDFFEKHISFEPDKNATGVYKTVKAYAENHGTTYYKEYEYKDEWGQIKKGKKFDYYVPNNPNEYVLIIYDHISLTEQERGLNLRECINKLSEYMIMFRNRYNYIPVISQQQGLDTTNLDAFKNNKIRPTLAGLSDSKATGKDCSMMLGITNPYAMELPEYLGYDIKKLKGNFRCIEVVLNRNGKSNGICPLLFIGESCQFIELPLPNDKVELDKVYKYLDKIRNKINITSTISMFAHSIIKKVKNLLE